MAEAINSLIDRLPLEVKTFLDIDKQGMENLSGFEYISFSSKNEAISKLLTDIYRDVISQYVGKSSKIQQYIEDTISYEYFHKKHGIVTVNTIFTPKKFVVGFSGDNKYFTDPLIKEYYENKKCNSPVCKLSEFIFVDNKKDKLYFGKKI
ncbi:MAG TPA: hypothetical protein VEC16_02995 [Alphaproteobacteria bacterium]|nr:hypothetical protein [Alphaproteobacteria bacterium]